MYMQSKTREQKVREFHKAMELSIDEELTPAVMWLRMILLQEECEEVAEAFKDLLWSQDVSHDSTKDWAEVLKELCDLQYVLSGTIISFKELSGVDFDVAFNRVHASNMSKLNDEGNPVKNDIGKVVKGPNYKPPSLLDLFERND